MSSKDIKDLQFSCQNPQFTLYTLFHSSPLLQPTNMFTALCCYDPGPIFHFPPFYSVLSVTRSPLVPLRATWTTTQSPDKSPDGSPDYSAVGYHMPSLCSPQHSAVSSSNPLWIASSLPHHDETASS